MEVGAEVWHSNDRMLIRAGSAYRSVDIQTLPFPGFPTDLQAPFVALLTQAEGVSTVHERVYEDRLRYTNELLKMGAISGWHGSVTTASCSRHRPRCMAPRSSTERG